MSTVTLAGAHGPGLRGLLGTHLAVLRTRSGLTLLALSVLASLGTLVAMLLVGQQTFDLTGADLARPLTGSIGIQLFGLLFGAMIAGSRYRHGTIVPTLLAEPRRIRVAASALLASGVVAAASAAAYALLGAAIALPWLAGQGVGVGEVLADPDLWWRVVGQVTAFTLTAVLGAALAVVLRGVLGPVLAVFGLSAAESALLRFVPAEWAPWTFFHNLSALTDPTASGLPTPIWQSALVVLAVVGAAVAAALVGVVRRDAA